MQEDEGLVLLTTESLAVWHSPQREFTIRVFYDFVFTQ